MHYSKSPAVSKFRLSLVPLNPSTFYRVYIVRKGGILVGSRYRDGPIVESAAIVMHYCIIISLQGKVKSKASVSSSGKRPYDRPKKR